MRNALGVGMGLNVGRRSRGPEAFRFYECPADCSWFKWSARELAELADCRIWGQTQTCPSAAGLLFSLDHQRECAGLTCLVLTTSGEALKLPAEPAEARPHVVRCVDRWIMLNRSRMTITLKTV
jgi:hypothetical protein